MWCHTMWCDVMQCGVLQHRIMSYHAMKCDVMCLSLLRAMVEQTFEEAALANAQVTVKVKNTYVPV